MDFNQISTLYREIIIEHAQNPMNKYQMENPDYHYQLLNPTCGDAIVIYIRTNGTIIDEVSFMGEGCAISIASASMMTQVMKNLEWQEAETLIANFNHLLKGETMTQNQKDKLEDAIILEGVKNFPARYKCAALAWLALEKAILEMKGAIS